MPCILETAHIIMVNRIAPYIDKFADEHGVGDVVLGARKGTQPHDIFATVSGALEVGRDRHDKAAVCSGDVASYHDSVAWGTLLAGLLKRGVPADEARAIIRLHRAPGVELEVMEHSTGLVPRTKGLLTGFLSAGLLARVPTEDAYLAVCESWNRNGFGLLVKGARLTCQVWSDNCFTYASDPATAIRMMEQLEDKLDELHHCRLKSGERQVVRAACRRYQEEELQGTAGRTWTLVPELRVLGPTLCCTGSPTEDVEDALAKVTAAFYRNSKLLKCSKVALSTRCAKLDAVALGILRSRAAAWPLSRTLLEKVSRHQSKLYGWMLALKRRPEETGQQFGARKSGRLKDLFCCHWARCVARCAITWLAHLQRHPSSAAAKTFAEQGFDWVLSKRQEGSGGRTLSETRTGTRAERGNVYRWDLQGWTAVCDPGGIG